MAVMRLDPTGPETVRMAGLGIGTMVPHLLEQLHQAVSASETSMTNALTAER